MAYPELEQALPKVFAMLGGAHVLTHIRQVRFDRGDRCGTLRALERAQPLTRRLAPLVILEELDPPPHQLPQTSSQRAQHAACQVLALDLSGKLTGNVSEQLVSTGDLEQIRSCAGAI